MTEDNLWEGQEVGQFGLPKKSDIPGRLPEDIDAEKAFISTICAPGAGRLAIECMSQLEIEDFVHPAHKAVLEAIRSTLAKDIPIDALTLKAELEILGTLGKVGGYTALVDLLNGEDVERPMVLLEVIKNKAMLRKLIHTGSKIVTEASGGGEPLEILSRASEAVSRLTMAAPSEHIIEDMSDLIDDLHAGRHITTQNGGRAMSWGDETLNNICPIPRGEPTLIVARPGVGKSALALQVIVSTIAEGLGRPLFLSLEMGRDKIKARIAAHLSGVNSRAFRDGQYDPEAIRRVEDRAQILRGMRVMFPHQQCQVEEIETLVRHAVDFHGCDSVVLDQFSHIHPPREAKKESFAIANAMMSQRLTALAKNLNLGWVTLGQINRDGEDSRRPNMKDLADTDRLAKDAAVILGLWNKGTDENQEVWGTVIKNRDDGFKGWAKQLSSDYGTCTFRVMQHETKPFTKLEKFAF